MDMVLPAYIKNGAFNIFNSNMIKLQVLRFVVIAHHSQWAQGRWINLLKTLIHYVVY